MFLESDALRTAALEAMVQSFRLGLGNQLLVSRLSWSSKIPSLIGRLSLTFRIDVLFRSQEVLELPSIISLLLEELTAGNIAKTI